jgi:hypothetical protein
MKIRVLQHFDSYEKGQVFEDWPRGMCELLIQRGLIEPVETAEQPEPEVERADVTARATPKKRR